MIESKKVILDVIEKISDIDFQRQVWVDQLKWDKILNFGEAVNILDDYNFFDKIENRDLLLEEGTAHYSLLDRFSKSLLEYKENENPVVMLTDPLWTEICTQASEVYQVLSYSMK